ncbi:MAG: hypothetical protein NT105_19805 [Verrucomicrobia bacterium]|nr:hypothetical protein [Verrucomicrobiota bacterium]
MKRPIGLYFVAAWCLFAIYFGILGFAFHSLPAGVIEETWVLCALIVVALPAAWLIIGLMKLNPIPRWVCIALLVCLTAWSAFMFTTTLWTALNVPVVRRDLEIRIGLVFPFILITMNTISIWYLSRRSFREFAQQFVQERQKQKGWNS